MSTVTRIQLDFPEEKVRELDQLMQQAGINTRKDLFNNALTLLVWAVKERQKGNKIVSLDEQHGTSRELVMPILEESHLRAQDQQPASLAATSSKQSNRRLAS